MKYINIFLLLLVIISISSCNTFKVRETIEALDSSITNYNVVNIDTISDLKIATNKIK